jgi:hypothetical protein
MLLKRDLLLPLKRENSFNADTFEDLTDFGIKFGRRRRSNKPTFERSAYNVDPIDFGISFG